MTALFRIVIAATALAVLALLAACGGTPGAPAPVTTSVLAPSSATQSAPPGSTSTSTRRSTPAPTSPVRPPVRTTTAKPVPQPPAGTAFAGENLSAAAAAELQQAVDEGHQPWRLDVRMVAQTFVLNRFGWHQVDCALADPHTAEVTDLAGGRMVTLQLRQPVREGAGGIWVVVSGVWLR